MELVTGDTLSTLFACRPMPLREALPIFRQIAMALEAAHERGIVHRDLKPSNVKVTADGRVKVLEISVSRKVCSASGSSPHLIETHFELKRLPRLGSSSAQRQCNESCGSGARRAGGSPDPTS